MKHKLFTLFVLLAILLAGLPAQTAHAASSTLFVDADSTCFAFCGGSWATAYPSLQTALFAASSTDQIWVAEGVYYPGAADRASTFTLKNGVAIYGGFNGTEDRLVQRDIAANPTILSGDIDRNDSQIPIIIDLTTVTGNTTNSYHVVSGVSGATLDGFIITAGFAGGSDPDNEGGGMYSVGDLTLMNITFSGNAATKNGGGMFSAGNPILTNVTFSGNRVLMGGGGMYINMGNPQLTDVTFSNNNADFGGGGLYSGNSNLTLTDVTFSGNTSAYGGGMRSDGGSPTLMNVTFSGNHAGHGGGMSTFGSSSSPSLANVTFSGNSADGLGGGMYNSEGDSTLTNVTFSGNSTSSHGGGMTISDGSPTLTNVTFSGNSSVNQGGGVYNVGSGTPTFTNTLIANSTSGGDCFNGVGSSLNAASSNNLIEDSTNSCGQTNDVNGNVIGLDPDLGPLANNGGSTLTHALPANSPAIDAGINASCPAADQRGAARPAGLYCDIGAFEGEPHPYILSITRADPNPANTASVGFDITFSEPVDNVHDYNFQVTTTGTISGAVVTGITGNNISGTVTVSTGTGSGTIRLDVPSGVGIVDMSGYPLEGLPYTSGETYTVIKNHAPTEFSLSNSSVAENQAGGATVGTFSSTDPDAGDTFTYSLVAGTGSADNAAFTISDSALQTAYPFNATVKNSYSVRVRTTDQGGLYFEKAFTITVTDLPAIFTDVPDAYWANTFIERLYNAGVTGGCSLSPLMYCPETNVNRAQMAVFLLRGEHGSTYAPPDVGTGTGFGDVHSTHWAAAWIKQLALEGITSGCGPSLFCPETSVTRDQMAVFLLRAKYGASYSPPPATGIFTDVPSDYWAAAWIEQLATEGITGGCGAGIYCPTTSVTRAQMAVFLVKAFHLP